VGLLKNPLIPDEILYIKWPRDATSVVSRSGAGELALFGFDWVCFFELGGVEYWGKDLWHKKLCCFLRFEDWVCFAQNSHAFWLWGTVFRHGLTRINTDLIATEGRRRRTEEGIRIPDESGSRLCLDFGG